MKSFHEYFQIQPAEKQAVTLCFIQSFLIGLPKYFTLTVASTLFLKYFDASQLPYIYIATAFLVPLTGVIHLQLQKRLTTVKLSVVTLAILITVSVCFWLSLRFGDAKWAALGLLAWFEVEFIFGSLVLANTSHALFDIRQGKRLFGLVNTGEVLAVLVSGLTIVGLVNFFGTENLLLLSIAGSTLALMNLVYIQSQFSQTFSKQDDKINQVEDPHVQQGTASLFKSKYLLLIFAAICFDYFIFYFIDNAFLKSVEAQYSDSNEMAIFLGRFLAVVGLIDLFMRSFLSRRWLSWFGVRGSYISIPVIISIGVLVTIFMDILDAPAMFLFAAIVSVKLLDRVLAGSVKYPVRFALYQPLNKLIRSKAQTVADSILGQISGGLAGLALLIISTYLTLSHISFQIILLFLLVGFCVAATFTGTEYKKALAAALRRRGLVGEKIQIEDATTLSVIESGLTSDDPVEVTYCVELLSHLPSDELDHRIRPLLDHHDTSVRLCVYHAYEKMGLDSTTPILLSRLQHENLPTCLGALLKAVASAGGHASLELLEGYLDHEREEVSVASLSAAIQYCGPEGKIAGLAKLNKLVHSDQAADRVSAANIIGNIDSADSHLDLIGLISDKDLAVRLAGIGSAGKLGLGIFVPILISTLNITALRSDALSSLHNLGNEVLDGVASYLLHQDSHEKIKIDLIHVCGNIGSEGATQLLKNHMDSASNHVSDACFDALYRCHYRASPEDKLFFDVVIAEKVKEVRRCHYAIQDLRTGVLNDDLLLVNGLSQKITQLQERILLLLSLSHPRDLVDKIWNNFIYGSSQQKAMAIELFENMFTKQETQLVLPVFELSSLNKSTEKLSTTNQEAPFLWQKRIESIIIDDKLWPDIWLKVCAVDFIKTHPIAGFEALFLTQQGNAHPMVQEAIESTTEFLSGTPLLKLENAITDRVSILKSVEIFSEIPDALLANIANMFSISRCEENETLFRQHEMGSVMFIIVKGEVSVNNEHKNLAHLGAENIFGEFSALCDMPRSATVATTAPSVFYTLSQTDLLRLVLDHNEIAIGIIRALVQKLQHSLVKQEKTYKLTDAELTDLLVPETDAVFIQPDECSDIEKLIILKSVSIFSQTEDEILMELAKLSREVYIPAGQDLFLKNDISTDMYVIQSGKIHVHNDDNTVAVLGPKEIIGELAALSSSPRSATATALTNTYLLCVSQNAINDLLWSKSNIFTNIVKVLIERLQKVS